MAGQKTVATTNSSTRHVFETMRIISRSDTPLGLNEIAESLDLPASTAHRALMTLEECGFATRVRQSARFEPGATLHHLIRSMVAQFPIRAASAGALSEISRQFDVTTSLNWRLGWSSMRLASFETAHESFQLRRIGELRPLHDGIGPSAILLALPETERNRYLAWIRDTVSGAGFNADRFETFSRQMADQGYLELPPSDNLGSYWILGFYWISMPVHRYDGEVSGSVSAGFSMNQRTGAGLTADIERVRDAFAGLQRDLDTDPESTRTCFDDLEPDAFGADSSPSRWKSGS